MGVSLELKRRDQFFFQQILPLVKKAMVLEGNNA